MQEFAPRDLYFNRELSWLAFNRRVLEEACNPPIPCSSGFASSPSRATISTNSSWSGWPASRRTSLLGVEETLGRRPDAGPAARRDHRRADRLVAEPAGGVGRAAGGARRGRDASSSARSRSTRSREQWLDQHFREQIFPVLTPQAIDPAHPFPVHSQQRLLADLRSRSAGRRRADPRAADGCRRRLPRFVRIPGETARYIALETLIRRKTGYPVPGIRAASAAAPSGSSATATSRSRRKPRTSSATSAARSSGAAAAA